MTRRFWVLAHRYVGLAMTLFLIIVGLTGSVLAFYHELDRWLNPELLTMPARDTPMLGPFVLRERAKALEPRARVDGLPFHIEPGEVYSVWPQPKTDPATGKDYALPYHELFLDPYTGERLGAQVPEPGQERRTLPEAEAGILPAWQGRTYPPWYAYLLRCLEKLAELPAWLWDSGPLFCWFPRSGLGTQCVKLLLHVSITRPASPQCGSSGLPSRLGSAGMILSEHGNGFEAWRVIERRIQAGGARLTLLAVDLCASEFQCGDELREAGASRPGSQARGNQ